MLPPTELYLGATHGTKWLAQPNALVGYTLTFVAMMAYARHFKPRWSLGAQVALALGWFVTFEAAYVWHTLGHILSAKRVNAPMHAVQLRWSAQINVYLSDNVTPRQHLGRAGGGPLASAVGAVAGYGLWRATRHLPVIGLITQAWYVFNLLAAIVAALPSPHFDAYALVKWWTTLRTDDEGLGEEAAQLAGWVVAGAALVGAVFFTVRGKGGLALGLLALTAYMVIDITLLRGRL
jgi:hypothetical protein